MQPTFNTTAAEPSYKEERFIFYEVLKTVVSPLTASSQSAEASILAVCPTPPLQVFGAWASMSLEFSRHMGVFHSQGLDIFVRFHTAQRLADF